MGKTIFVDGNPAQGQVGTLVTAAFLNALQTHRHDGLDKDGSAPSNYGSNSGSVNAISITLSPPLTAHVIGMPISFKAAGANTAACTLNVDGLGAKSIVQPDGTALPPGIIAPYGIVTVVYDGANYQLLTGSAPVPAGIIIYTAKSTPPYGYLKANGAAISRSSYAALFAALGTTYGAGDGSTTFNVPDLRAEFVRGWDDGRGIDSGRVLGSWQDGSIISHRHIDGSRVETGSACWSPTTTVASGQCLDHLETVASSAPYTSYEGGTETRPRNIALLACIKY